MNKILYITLLGLLFSCNARSIEPAEILERKIDIAYDTTMWMFYKANFKARCYDTLTNDSISVLNIEDFKYDIIDYGIYDSGRNLYDSIVGIRVYPTRRYIFNKNISPTYCSTKVYFRGSTLKYELYVKDNAGGVYVDFNEFCLDSVYLSYLNKHKADLSSQLQYLLEKYRFKLQ